MRQALFDAFKLLRDKQPPLREYALNHAVNIAISFSERCFLLKK